MRATNNAVGATWSNKNGLQWMYEAQWEWVIYEVGSNENVISGIWAHQELPCNNNLTVFCDLPASIFIFPIFFSAMQAGPDRSSVWQPHNKDTPFVCPEILVFIALLYCS